MDASWYEKLAKSGWLGTKAKVSSEKGHPVWKTEDHQGEALKRVMQKSAAVKPSGSSDT